MRVDSFEIHSRFTSRLWRKLKLSIDRRDLRQGTAELYVAEHDQMLVRCLSCNTYLCPDLMAPPFILEGSDWVIPASIQPRYEDGKPFVRIHLELSIQNQGLVTEAAARELREMGILWTPRGRPERVVDHTASPTQVKRYYRKALSAGVEFRVWRGPSRSDLMVVLDLQPDWETYWTRKGSPKCGGVMVEQQLFQHMVGSRHLLLTTAHLGGRLLGAAWFIDTEDERRWIVSMRLDDRQFDQLKIGQGLLQASRPSNAPLNLGLDMPYKADIWKADQVWTHGLQFVDHAAARWFTNAVLKVTDQVSTHKRIP